MYTILKSRSTDELFKDYLNKSNCWRAILELGIASFLQHMKSLCYRPTQCLGCQGHFQELKQEKNCEPVRKKCVQYIESSIIFI